MDEIVGLPGIIAYLNLWAREAEPDVRTSW